MSNKRLTIISFFFMVLFLVIVVKLIKIQIIDHQLYNDLASGQHEIFQKLLADRGKIYFQETNLTTENKYKVDNLHLIATNKIFYQIYAIPLYVKNPEETVLKLMDFIFEQPVVDKKITIDSAGNKQESEYSSAEKEELSKKAKDEYYQQLLAKLTKKNDPYEPLKNKVEESVVLKIKSLKLDGIEFAEENYRYYTEDNIASQVIGFVGAKDQEKMGLGLYGIESYFEEELVGKNGSIQFEKDTRGRMITINDKNIKNKVDGDNIILTIDYVLETFACEKLNQALKDFKALNGSLIAIDPFSGAIIIMCGAPDFDLNNYNKVENLSTYNNPAIFWDYEPGSIFKPFTMASALDQGLVEPESTYNDEGVKVIAGYQIRNSDKKAHGITTMTQVLENSLNLGTIYLIEKMGPAVFFEYVKKFGFGSKTGITLPSENPGNINSLHNNKFIYAATASFGQGITSTPLQLITAYSSLVNGGKLYQPYIVDQIIKTETGEIIRTDPKFVRQVISERAATIIRGMMVSVIENGHGQKAQVKGFYVGGKTGTAQKIKEGSKEYGEDTIHSFVGFAPSTNPKFAMIVKLDSPKGVQYAESSVAQVFGEVADFILKYYQVPKDKK